MKPSIRMTEAEAEREVERITTKIAKLMTPCDHGMTGAVVANLLAMYLWTFPPDKRADMVVHLTELAFALLARSRLEQAPPGVRAPS